MRISDKISIWMIIGACLFIGVVTTISTYNPDKHKQDLICKDFGEKRTYTVFNDAYIWQDETGYWNNSDGRVFLQPQKSICWVE